MVEWKVWLIDKELWDKHKVEKAITKPVTVEAEVQHGAKKAFFAILSSQPDFPSHFKLKWLYKYIRVKRVIDKRQRVMPEQEIDAFLNKMKKQEVLACFTK